MLNGKTARRRGGVSSSCTIGTTHRKDIICSVEIWNNLPVYLKLHQQLSSSLLTIGVSIRRCVTGRY